MTEEATPGGRARPNPREMAQWVVWRYEERDGKRTKVPYNPKHPDRRASSTNPYTWSTRDHADAIAKARDFDGVGFVFSKDDPICGIDLDSDKNKKTGELVYKTDPETGEVISPVLDPETGEIAPWADRVVRELDSYTEISPSGTGLHIYVMATLPADTNFRKGQVEMYDRGRYFTVTSQPYGDCPRSIEPRQEQLDALRARVWPEEAEIAPVPDPKPKEEREDATEEPQDDEVLEIARNAKDGDKFERLWNGDTSLHEGDHSGADLALCSKLLFYSRGDVDHADRLFRRSGLMRPKWDERRKQSTYGADTLKKALSGMTDFYTPPSGPARDGRTPKRDGKNPLPSHAEPDTYGQWDGRDGRDGSLEDKRRKAVEPVSLDTKPGVIPFPTHVLYPPMRQIVEEAVEAMGIAPDLMILPMLGALSSAIGASRVGWVKRGWSEPATLFLATVASPGSMKSPAAGPALKPVYRRQDFYRSVYNDKKKEHEQSLREYEVSKKDQLKNDEVPGPPPPPPIMRRTITGDTTLEALVSILEDNPRGVYSYQDELTGWVMQMDQYKGGKGSDRQHYLSIWDARTLVVDRKNRNKEPIIVNTPIVSICGGIQPTMLHMLGNAMEDGMMDRFLFAFPDIGRLRFSEKEISEEAERKYKKLYDGLSQLSLGKDDYDNPQPKAVKFAFDARRLFGELIDQLNDEIREPGFNPRLEGVWAKMRGYLVRLSLLMAMIRVVDAEDPTLEEEITTDDVLRSWTLIRYFQSHARRVYSELSEADHLDLFAASLRSFLNQEGGEWSGTAAELHALLSDREAKGMPANEAHLVKRIKASNQRTDELEIQRHKSGSVRTISLKLLNYVPPDPVLEEEEEEEGEAYEDIG